MQESRRREPLREVVASTSPQIRCRDTSSLVLDSQSPPYRALIDKLERLARTDEDIALSGATGVGKTVLGTYVHERSRRAGQPLVTVAVGALSPELAASELFGHRRGAFTGASETRAGAFAAASGGTLILDEVGKASLSVQRLLLGAIETRRFNAIGDDRQTVVNTRIITTSNEPLDRLVAEGSFLDDFDARLGPFRLRVPTLKERLVDLPSLACALVQDAAARFDFVRPPSISPSLLEWLGSLSWRRNLRQLIGAIRQLLFAAQGAGTLDLSHVDDDLRAYVGETASDADGGQQLDRARIEDALRKSAGKVAGAARLLGVSRTRLYRRMECCGLRPSSV